MGPLNVLSFGKRFSRVSIILKQTGQSLPKTSTLRWVHLMLQLASTHLPTVVAPGTLN